MSTVEEGSDDALNAFGLGGGEERFLRGFRDKLGSGSICDGYVCMWCMLWLTWGRVLVLS